MGFAFDLTGRRFGRLVALRRVGTDKSRSPLWECQCDCGALKVVTSNHLLNNRVFSCGCLNSDMTTERNFKHGETKTRLHRAWLHMRQRCFDIHCDKYAYYGGRGITVCDEWKDSYITFRDWAVANGYQDDLTLDRINPDGNYEPSNCRWATLIEQANNKRSNIMVMVGEEVMTVAEASRLTGINYGTLISRYRRAVRQIGNAVPPLVALALSRGIL